jgi:hypothetical protein
MPDPVRSTTQCGAPCRSPSSSPDNSGAESIAQQPLLRPENHLTSRAVVVVRTDHGFPSRQCPTAPDTTHIRRSLTALPVLVSADLSSTLDQDGAAVLGRPRP